MGNRDLAAKEKRSVSGIGSTVPGAASPPTAIVEDGGRTGPFMGRIPRKCSRCEPLNLGYGARAVPARSGRTSRGGSEKGRPAHVLASASRDGSRSAEVHGENCPKGPAAAEGCKQIAKAAGAVVKVKGDSKDWSGGQSVTRLTSEALLPSG